MAGSRTLKLSILADVDNLQKNLKVGEKEVEGFGGKLEKFGKVAAAAFAAAAAAAAAYAGKLAIEGVKAAIEDEAAQKRLATALENVTGATELQIKAVEEQILQTSLATGVADDRLRPALQRLAVSTGSVTESQKLLKLALDISAATGKDVETVSTALAKAYDGNLGALTRLGVGLSATEAKTLGFEGTVAKLSETFGGSATVQAETFEGRIARLKVSFEEAKESVGTALLPIIEKLLKFIVETAIPKFEELKAKAVDPVIKAFKDNEDTLRSLWKFTKDFVIPLFTGTFKIAIEGVGKSVSLVLTIISKVVSGIEGLINIAIDGINALIRAWNAIPAWAKPGGNIAYVPNVNFGGKNSGSNTVAPGGLPFGASAGTGTIPNITGGGNVTSGIGTGMTTGTGTGTGNGTGTGSSITFPSGTATSPFTSIAGSTFDPARFRAGEEAGNVTININGAIDPASTARQIADLLNNEAAVSGTFSNLGVSRFATRAI